MSLQISDRYNLVDHFVDRHIREGRGDKTAIICEDRRLTYSEIAEQVKRVGNGLLNLGLEEKQRVLLVLPDIPEFAAAYLGTMKIGAVVVPTSTALRASDYAYFLEESQAKIAIVHSTLLPEFVPALSRQHYCRNVIVCGEPAEGHIRWNEFLDNSSANLESAATSKDQAAFWLWTSGSTGRPKAAVHLHKDWVYCCEYYARGVLDIQAEDVTFSSSKLFHAYGLGNGLMFPFHVGATTVLYPGKPHAKAVLETAQANRPTLFFSVPTLYAAMLQEAEQKTSYDLMSVRLAASAAEPLPAEIFRRWKRRFGVEILDGIGSTEALHIYLSARAGQVRAGSTGQVVPGYELALVDHAGQPAPPGAIGDLMVAGPSITPCYWNRNALTQERMRGRWFFTGDKYTVDADGYYWYAGRSDDMFRVSGQWVSPIEVECALIEHPCVLEAAVVAFEEQTGLHTPMAFVVLQDGYQQAEGLVQELQDFVKQRITPYKYPRRIEFLTELPKTAAGKLLRYKLREMNRTAPVSQSSVTPIRAAAVVGAGTMGRGIAMCLANAGIPVLLKEAKHEALEAAMQAIEAAYRSSVQKGRLSADQMRSRISKILPQLDYAGFDAADIVIEAAFEDIAVKRSVFTELGGLAKPGAILATNTSYLNIDEIAEACSRPEAVIGLHFFSPAHVMRLLEVVPGKATDRVVTDQSLALAKQLGKLAVVAGNCPGFIGNRMFRLYRREAQLLLEEGSSPRQVDSALEAWGMAMGPFAVQDLTGIDIAMSSRHVFAAADRPGFRNPRVMEMLYSQNRFGQKTGAGWYRYDEKRNAESDPEVEALIERAARESGTSRRSISDEEIIERTIYALINEGARVLEEGCALRASDIDLVYINGYGFSAHRGGPMHYADEVGLAKVHKRILEFRATHGANWEPSPLLARLAASGSSFSAWGSVQSIPLAAP